MTSELKPCPHCGGPVTLFGTETTGYFVACNTRYCYGFNCAKFGYEETTNSWNRRAPEPAGREVVAFRVRRDGDAALIPSWQDGKPDPVCVKEWAEHGYWFEYAYGDTTPDSAAAGDDVLADDMVGIAHLIRRNAGWYPRLVSDADKIEQAATLLRRLSRRAGGEIHSLPEKWLREAKRSIGNDPEDIHGQVLEYCADELASRLTAKWEWDYGNLAHGPLPCPVWIAWDNGTIEYAETGASVDLEGCIGWMHANPPSYPSAPVAGSGE